MKRLSHFLILVVASLLLSCDSSPKLVEVEVSAQTFVNSYSNPKPRLTDLGGTYLIRLALTPAEQDDAKLIVEICRSGSAVLASVQGDSGKPFLISGVGDDGDVLAIVPTRERAVAILKALDIQLTESPGD